MPDTQISIDFVGPDIESDVSISVDLDDEANGGKSSFCVGGTAFLRVFVPDSEAEYQCENSFGKIRKTAIGRIGRVSQTVTFGNSDSASLSYPLESIAYWEWWGDDPGVTPIFSGQNIILPKKITSALRIYYFTIYDQWQIAVNETIGDLGSADAEALPVVFSVIQGENSASTTVNFLICEEEEEGPDEYDVLVSDTCSGSPIPGATVHLGGKIYMTGSDGLAVIGELPAGVPTTWAEAANYFTSDKYEIIITDE